MSDRDHVIEGHLLIEVRKVVVAINHALEHSFIQHHSSAHEFEQRLEGLRAALADYECLMQRRID